MSRLVEVDRDLSLKEAGRRRAGHAYLGLEDLQLGHSLFGLCDEGRGRQLWRHQARQGLVASLCLGLITVTALRDKGVHEVGQEVEQT